jgi:hypothetical protein
MMEGGAWGELSCEGRCTFVSIQNRRGQIPLMSSAIRVRRRMAMRYPVRPLGG